VLRGLLIAVAAVLIGVGVVLIARGICPPGWQALGVGALLGVGTLFERWRYRPRTRADGQWQPTGERFLDPTTGKPVEVLYDPGSGERRYESKDP
jgi:hypothetical protein